MGLRSRLVIADLPHHVVHRGHNRRAVFDTDADRMAYLTTLAEFRLALGVKVYAWCLMTNHVHLVLDPGRDTASLALLMKRLGGRHTRRLNRLCEKTGTAWEGRYRSSPIDSEAYLLACTRYVELNPVRAGVVGDPAEYPWSSFRARMGLSSQGILDLDPCFLSLGSTLDAQRAAFRRWVGAEVAAPELEMIRTSLQRNQLTGSDDFAQQVAARTGARASKRGRGRPPKSSKPQENKSDLFLENRSDLFF